MATRAEIEAFANAIAQKYAPEKIILFGSYAYGHPTPDSDVDLMVIMDHTMRNVEKSIEIGIALRRPFPLDLFVRRPQDIRQRLQMGDQFIREIVERGHILYEESHRRVD
jgi:predicted nucleotidyltransferase